MNISTVLLLCNLLHFVIAIEFHFDPFKSLRVVGSPWNPFVYVDKHGVRGIDISLVRVIADKLNFSIDIQLVTSHHSTVDRYGRAALLIGAYGVGQQSQIDGNLFTASTSYYSDDYTWCIKRSTLLPLELNLFHVCSIIIWFLIVLHVIVQSVVLNILLQFDRDYAKRDYRDWIYVFLFVSMPAVIGVSQRFHPKHTFLRIYYGLNLLCGVIIVAYLLTFGYSFLKRSIWSYQIHTVAELVANDFRCFGTDAILEQMRKQTVYSANAINTFAVCNDIDKCLDYLSSDDSDDLAIGISRAHVMTSELFKHHKIFCFERTQSIASYSRSLLIQNHSMMNIDDINAIISKVIEGGLIVKWKKENCASVQAETGYAVTDSLGMNYVSAIFYFVYFPGVIGSTIVFLVEHFVAQKMKQRYRLKLWRFLSRLCDGRRYIWKIKN